MVDGRSTIDLILKPKNYTYKVIIGMYDLWNVLDNIYSVIIDVISSSKLSKIKNNEGVDLESTILTGRWRTSERNA